MTGIGNRIILNGTLYIRKSGETGVFVCAKCCFYDNDERLCRAPIECLQECSDFEYWKIVKNKEDKDDRQKQLDKG